MGNLTFAWVSWGKLNRKCQVSKDCLSLTAINKCLEEMYKFSGYPKNLIDCTLSEVTFSARQWELRKQTKKTHETIIPALSQLIIQQ